MGVADVGALEPGRRADFVALRRDPLTDITAVYDVAGVYRNGYRVVDDDGFTRPAPPTPTSPGTAPTQHEEH